MAVASTTPEAVCLTKAKNDEKLVLKELCTEDEKPCEREAPSNGTEGFSNYGSHFKQMVKAKWKFLVIVVLLLPTLALLAACAWLQGITIILPIFIYPSFIISGCSLLIGTKRYGYRVTTIQHLTVPPAMVDSSQLNVQEQPIHNDQETEIDNSDNKIQSLIKSFCTAPPPPPPPPSSSPSDRLIQVECRKLLWDVVGRDSLKKGVIWNKMAKKLSAEDIIDVDELSSLFGVNRALTPKSFKALTVKKRILDTKKSLNISITLAHAKLSVQNVKEALLKGTTNLPTDFLENFLKFAPNELEERALQKQGAEDSSVLDNAETFFYKIITTIPMYKERIRTVLIKDTTTRTNNLHPTVSTDLRSE